MGIRRYAWAACMVTAACGSATAAEREVFVREAEAFKWSEFAAKASVIDAEGAGGGQAVRIGHGVLNKWPHAAARFIIDRVELQDRCRLRVRCRGSNMLDLSRPVGWRLHFHNLDTKAYRSFEQRTAGFRFRPNGWTDIDIPFRMPPKRGPYRIEVFVRWIGQDHWLPTPGPTWPAEQPKPELEVDTVRVLSSSRSGPLMADLEPGKVRFAPGERAWMEVTLANAGDAEAEVRLRGRVAWGLDRQREVFDQEVTLPGGASGMAVKPTWTAGREEGGRRVTVELVEKGQVVDRADHMVTVCSHPYQFSVGRAKDVGRPSPALHGVFYVGAATYQQSAEAVRDMRRRYGQWKEFFSWAPGDLADLSPEEDPFIGGEGAGHFRGREEIRMQVRLLKAAGIHPVTYINGTAWADAGYKLFQKHPDWFLYDTNGEVAHYSMRRRYLYTRRNEIDFDGQEYGRVYFQGVLNTSLPAVRRFIAEEIVRSAKQMGWGGLRNDVRHFEVHPNEYDWQGKPIVTSQAEADRRSAEYIRDIKARIAKELPEFTHGYNFCSRAENVDWPLTWRERCKDKAWMLDEVMCSYQGKQSPFHWWDKFARELADWGAEVRKLGGVYDPYDIRRSGGKYVVDRVYATLFRLIAGGHFYSPAYFSSAIPLGDVAGLATRHSPLFFDLKLLRIKEPKPTFDVTAEAPIWWDGFVFSRPTADGGRQVILHLVNPPVADEIEDDPLSRMRPPLRNVRVTAKTLDGKPPKRAFLLAAEPDEPWQEPAIRTVPLTLKPRGGAQAVTVPSVLFWKAVVFEY